MSAPTPELIPQPFANGAGPSFRNEIPDTSADPQEADYASGFKPVTFQPVASGGKPPLGQDVNGILYAVTTHLYALQGGQLQKYRADVAAALGGYAFGALLAMADGDGWWISTTVNNSTDPDAGGAGWEPVYAYGSAAISGLAGGIRTLTAIEASRGFLIFTGNLSGNQQIVVPNSFRHWLAINSCTMNGNTLTVKTAAGLGVDVPAGGSASPTAIYCDTVNVNRVFAPAAIPTSVAPAPDTLVLRDNLGRAFGLTGTLGDASMLLATTEFVNPGASLAQTGWHKFPNGLILQWGFAVGATGPGNLPVTFPLSFPNNFFAAVCATANRNPVSSNDGYNFISSPSLGGMTIVVDVSTFGPNANRRNGYWVALGN